MIDPDTIQWFLNKEPPAVPPFKGMSPAALHSYIERETGIPFRPLTEPRYWQLESLAFALYVKKGFSFLSPRLGKTKLSLDWARHLKQAGLWKGKGLVIAHAPVGIDIWNDENKKHSDLKLFPVQNSANVFLDALESDCDLIVIPWSGLQWIFGIQRGVTKGKNVGREKRYPDHEILKLAAPVFSLAIMDEIHKCKNHNSLTWQIAGGLTSQCDYLLGLTGTPQGRNHFDLWAQAYLIDRGETPGRNFHFFEQAFGTKVYNHFSKYKVQRSFDKKLLPILKRKMDSIAMSYDFKEVKDVKVIPGIVKIPMHEQQAQEYSRFLSKHVNDIIEGNQTKRENMFTRMRQIASGFLPFTDEDGDSRVVSFASAKLDWLEDFLVETDPSQSILIYHEFMRTGEMITGRLAKLGIVYSWLYGKTKDRKAEIERFQSGQARVFVFNSAGNAGIDLSAADYFVFYESPVSPIVRAQAEARPMARDRPLMLDDLLCAPIERRILEFVKEGKNALHEILRDPKQLLEN